MYWKDWGIKKGKEKMLLGDENMRLLYTLRAGGRTGTVVHCGTYRAVLLRGLECH